MSKWETRNCAVYRLIPWYIYFIYIILYPHITNEYKLFRMYLYTYIIQIFQHVHFDLRKTILHTIKMVHILNFRYNSVYSFVNFANVDNLFLCSSSTLVFFTSLFTYFVSKRIQLAQLNMNQNYRHHITSAHFIIYKNHIYYVQKDIKHFAWLWKRQIDFDIQKFWLYSPSYYVMYVGTCVLMFLHIIHIIHLCK